MIGPHIVKRRNDQGIVGVYIQLISKAAVLDLGVTVGLILNILHIITGGTHGDIVAVRKQVHIVHHPRHLVALSAHCFRQIALHILGVGFLLLGEHIRGLCNVFYGQRVCRVVRQLHNALAPLGAGRYLVKHHTALGQVLHCRFAPTERIQIEQLLQIEFQLFAVLGLQGKGPSLVPVVGMVLLFHALRILPRIVAISGPGVLTDAQIMKIFTQRRRALHCKEILRF